MIRNIVFFVKNLFSNWNKTPKDIRGFSCVYCGRDFIFPITSKDYLICNDCWIVNIGEEE